MLPLLRLAWVISLWRADSKAMELNESAQLLSIEAVYVEVQRAYLNCHSAVFKQMMVSL